MCLLYLVSIRARVRAGDSLRSCCRREYNCFNPRPRASGRLCSNAKMRFRCTVSIRARVRAGDPAVAAADASMILRSAPACEQGDYRPIRCTAGAGRFNPRPRASGRRCFSRLLSIQNRFNPRPRASGRRRDFQAAPCAPQRFNPRPRASGRTPAVPDARLPLDGFNPRPRASGRPVDGLRSAWENNVSIRARVRAGDPAPRDRIQIDNQFQSAPACERATSPCKYTLGQLRRFNPRPRASGRRGSKRRYSLS